MALAEDASSPAALSGGGISAGGATSANFNPPANSLIMVVATSDASTVGTSATATVTDNIGNTFTSQVERSASNTGYGGIFTQYLTSSQTGYNVKVVLNSVQMQGANSAGYLFEIYVITGAASVQNGATASAAAPSSTMTTAITPTTLNSYIYGGANSWTSGASLTAAANTTKQNGAQNGGSGDAWGIFRSTSAIASLSSQTFGFTNSETHVIVAYEVLPVVALLPTVTTSSVSDANGSTAIGSGNVTDDGGNTITERGFCWSVAANPTTADSTATSAGTTGAYNAALMGLTNGITYHMRAYASNANGTSYGSDVAFQVSIAIGWTGIG